MRFGMGIAVKVMVVLLSVTLLGCATPEDYYREEVEKSPLHVKNFPPSEPAPIDGIWRDSYGNQITIDRGRAYNSSVHLGIALMRVYWKDIQQVAPGRYRAKGSGFSYKKDTEIAISVISPTELVARSESHDWVFTLVRLNNAKWFQEDFAKAGSAPPMDVAAGKPSLEISRLEVSPGMIVSPGAKFTLNMDVLAKGVTGDKTPVRFYYTISKDKNVLFTSNPSTMQARPGKPEARRINLAAAPDHGVYVIEALAESGDLKAKRQATLVIGDRNLILDSMVGTWVVDIPGSNATKRWFKVIRSGDGLTLAGAGLIGGLPFLKYQMRLNGNQLYLWFHTKPIQGDCWWIEEINADISGDLFRIPGELKVLDGDWCAAIGSKLHVSVIKTETKK